MPRGDVLNIAPAAARGLEVSLGGFLQNQLIQRQISDSSSQPQILPLELLEAPCLLDLQAAVLLAPTNGMDGSPSTASS